MTFRLFKLRSLFAKAESTFSTDVFGANPTAADRLEAEDITLELAEEFLERTAQTQQLGPVAGLIGGKGGKLKFKVGLRSLGGVAPNAGAGSGDTANLAGALAQVLLGCNLMRVQQVGQTGDAVQPVVANQIKLASQAEYGAQLNSDGTPDDGVPIIAIKKTHLEARLIPGIDAGQTQTVGPCFSAAPLANQEIFAADCFYPRPDAQGIDPDGNVPKTPGTVTFIVFGDGVQYTLTGCGAPPPKISGDATKRIFLEFEFMIDDWTPTSRTLPGEELQHVHEAMTGRGATLLYDTNGTTTVPPTPIAGFEFDPGVTLSPILSTQGTQGRAGWAPTAMKPTLKIKPYYNASWRTHYEARDVKQVLLQIGTDEGYTFLLAIPYAQIQKYPAEADNGGLLGCVLELVATLDVNGGKLRPFYYAFL